MLLSIVQNEGEAAQGHSSLTAAKAVDHMLLKSTQSTDPQRAISSCQTH